MNRRITTKFLEIISFILISLLIIMLLREWSYLNREVVLLFHPNGNILIKGSKFCVWIPFMFAMIFFIGTIWLKKSSFLSKRIKGRDSLENYEVKEELTFGLLTIRVDVLILCILFELSMIANVNLTSSILLITLMTVLLIIIQIKYCRDHKI